MDSQDPLQILRARLHYWHAVFGRLLAIADRLSRPSQDVLTLALGHLLQRLVVRWELIPPEDAGVPCWGENLDDSPEPTVQELGTTLLWSRKLPLPNAAEQRELEVLLALGEAHAGAAAGPALGERELIDEFRALKHLGERTEPELRLLTAPLCAAWWKLRQGLEEIVESDRRLTCEIAMHRVIRALYAIALGLPHTSGNVLLAHRVGESILRQPHSSRTAPLGAA